MNNKRWYILFSVLILLMIGYVVYVYAATEHMATGGIVVNISNLLLTNSTGGKSGILTNNTEILAGVFNLTLHYIAGNGSTNASWFIINNVTVSDNRTILITNNNGSNLTAFGTYDFATNYDADLHTRTFSNARSYSIMLNITNDSSFASGAYNADRTIVLIRTFKIYPHNLMNNRNNETIKIGGEFTKKDGTVTNLNGIISTSGYLTNLSTRINVTGKVILNGSIAAGNMTTNVSWYARGDYDKDSDVDEIVIGLNHSIGQTGIVWDTSNVSDGFYNITMHVTNLSSSNISGHVFNLGNSFNKTILTVIVDNTAPSVSNDLSDTDAIIYTRGEIKATCGFSDPSPGSGLSPSTQVLELEKPNGEIVTAATGTDANNEYSFKEADTAATGTYKVKCSATDGVNQNTVTEKTFQVFARGGPSSATGGGGKKTVEETEGGEAGAVEQPTGPTGAAVGEQPGASATGGGAAPSEGTGTGSTVAIIVAIIIIAGVVIYFLVKGKPGKKGQIKFSRAELKPKNY
ncbi:hypothetical protein HYV88_00105 [Candidatus Woesearchaeota archaeon]|nr:hypothetical protein [Candidatus Woesearchaeota archaeon]